MSSRIFLLVVTIASMASVALITVGGIRWEVVLVTAVASTVVGYAASRLMAIWWKR